MCKKALIQLQFIFHHIQHISPPSTLAGDALDFCRYRIKFPVDKAIGVRKKRTVINKQVQNNICIAFVAQVADDPIRSVWIDSRWILVNSRWLGLGMLRQKRWLFVSVRNPDYLMKRQLGKDRYLQPPEVEANFALDKTGRQ